MAEPGDELGALEAELARELLEEQSASGLEAMATELAQVVVSSGAGAEADAVEELDELEAEFVELTSPRAEGKELAQVVVSSGAGAEADAVEELDELEAEFVELTSPRAQKSNSALAMEVDVEAAFEAMMADSGQTDGGLVFVRDPTSAELQSVVPPLGMKEASDTDESAGSTDSARSSSPQAWAHGMIVDIETGDGWERGVIVLGPAESGEADKMSVKFPDGSVEDWETAEFEKPNVSTPGNEAATTQPTDQSVERGASGSLDGLAQDKVETADLGGRVWTHQDKLSVHDTQYQVQVDDSPAVFGLHEDHVSVVYLDDPTGLSGGANRQIFFTDIRSWRSDGNNVQIELKGSGALSLACKDSAGAEVIADELAATVSTARRATEAATTQPTDQSVERGASGSLDGLAQDKVETADLGGRKASVHDTQYQVQVDDAPAVFGLHEDHVSVVYLDDPTGLSGGANRQIFFTDIRSWRSDGNNVRIQLKGSGALSLACKDSAGAEVIANELAHFSLTAHAIATATAANINLERSVSEQVQLQAQISELKARLQHVQKAQRLQTGTAVDPHTSLEIGDSDLVAALDEAQAKVQEERLSSSKIAQELKTVSSAYADTLAQLHQVTDQYGRELARRRGMQKQDDATGTAVQQPHREPGSAQEVEQLRAQLAEAERSMQAMAAAAAGEKQQIADELVQAREQLKEQQVVLATSTQAAQALKAQLVVVEAEAAINAAKAREAEAKCTSLTANLAATEKRLRSLQAQPSLAALDVAAELVEVKAALAAETKARNAEQEALSSIIATHQAEIAALTAEHQVEMQRERHTAQERISDCEHLMVEVNQWLILSEQVRPQYPNSQQQAIINKLRADFSDLQVDHEMEIAKLERQVGAQARELSSATEKIMRAEAAREEAENVAIGLAEGLDDKSVLSASRSSSQLEEEKAVEVQKLQRELNAAKDEKVELLEQIDDLNSRLQAEDKSPRQNALAIAEIAELQTRLLDTTSQLERVTLQHTAAQEELRKKTNAVVPTGMGFLDESLNTASPAENKLIDASVEVKQLEEHLHTTSKELEAFRGKYADAERQRQEETRQAYTRAENKAMIADIFAFCDATGSGVLHQDEYKLYLEGIGVWGTPPRVDDKFDAQWIVECTQMGCDHEVGITWEAFEGHIYAQYCEDLSKEGTQQLEEHLAGVKRIVRAKIAEIKQDNIEMRDSIKTMLAQHRSQSQADKEEADTERTRRHTAEAEAERLAQHWMDAEMARVIELGIVEAVCDAEAHEKTKLAAHTATRHSSEQLTLKETLAATRQELSAMVQLRSEAELSAKKLQQQLQEYESGLSAESKTRQAAEATVDAHATAIEELREELEASRQELAATVAAAKAEQGTASAKLASKEAELAVAMAKAEGELGVVATERNAALQTVSLHEQRLAEKEADFAKAAQEEVAVLHTKLKLADQRLDRVSRHTATLVAKARAEEKAAWTEEKRTLTARLKAQEMEIDHVLTVRVAALQEQVTSTVVAVETKAAGVELALRERLEQEESSAKAAQAVAAAEISRLAGLLDTAERTLLDRVPTLESALSKAERETHAARAAHATDRAAVLDQHAAAIAAAEQAKATLLQESSERISAVMAQASESTASLSSEIAVKASQWDEDRKRMTIQLDMISSKLDALQVEYDKETAAHKKCQIALEDKERTIAIQEEASKHMGGLLRKAIDEKTASSAALAERTAAWNALKSSLTRDRDVALKECDGLIKRLKQCHAEQLSEVAARYKEELAFAKIEQDDLRARLGQKDLAHSKTVTALEATMRTLAHDRDMACAELQRRKSSFGKERQQLIAERDASRMQADEAEVSSALAAQQLYDIGTELSTERIESRRAQDTLRTEMLQSEHRLRSLLVDSERKKQKWAADATWLESSADQVQQESARRVAEAEHRAAVAETKLLSFISRSAALLDGKGALSTIEDTRNRRKHEQGGLWVFINEDEGVGPGSDERVRSPLPEVTPREVPLHIPALEEEVDEGIPPEDGGFVRSSEGPVAMRDYSYSYNANRVGTSFGAVPVTSQLATPEKPGKAGDPSREDTL